MGNASSNSTPASVSHAKAVCRNLLALQDSQTGLAVEDRQVVEAVLRAFNVIHGSWSDNEKCKFIMERIDALTRDVAFLQRASPHLQTSNVKKFLKGLLFLAASLQVQQTCAAEIQGSDQCKMQLQLVNPQVPIFAQPADAARYFVSDIVPDVSAFGHDPVMFAKAYQELERISGVQKEPVVTFVLGGAGAGKGYSLKHVIPKRYPAIVEGMKNALVLNTDNIMESLPGYSVLSGAGDLSPLLHYGSYHNSESFSVPVTHINAADVYHVPAEEINEQLQTKLLNEHRSFVFDGTGNTLSSLERRIRRAKQAGFKVNVVVIFAEADIRWERARQRAVTSGRYVPEQVVKKGHNPAVWKAFLEEKQRQGLIDVAVFDTNT